MSTRSTAKLSKDCENNETTGPNGCKQIVMILSENNLELTRNDDNQPSFCKLKHPKSGESSMYMFTHKNEKIFELVTFNESFHSWFIGDVVQKDGLLYLVTAMDPVFLILPYLTKAYKAGKFMQLDFIVNDVIYPENERLTSCNLDYLDYVADLKGHEGFFIYRYNKEKTLSWLKLKVFNIVAMLKQNNIDVSFSAMLSTFTKSTKSFDNSEDDFVRYACGLLSDYLEPDLTADLLNELGLSENLVPTKDDLSENTSANKKSKFDVPLPLEDYSQTDSVIGKKMEKLTNTQRRLNKVDKTGIKSISSFFSSKMKKK